MNSINVIASAEQVAALPAGQWVITEDGKKACLFDTHMGFPQRMWGMKADAGTKGYVQSFTSIDYFTYPAHLADIVEDFQCPHTRTNECGQCLICGAPEVAESRPMFFESFGDFSKVDA